MVNNPAARDELTALLRAREPLYSQAELVADTSKHSAEEVTEMIAQQWGKAVSSE